MKLTMPWNAQSSATDKVAGQLDGVRKTLADEAEHIAQVAAQIGRDLGRDASKLTSDAGTQVADVAHDASAQASGLAQQLVAGAAKLGRDLAAGGRERAQTLGRDVQALGEDLRQVRVTTEPKKTGPDLMPGVALLGGIAGGLAFMYFFDPEQGRRRRALLRDQFNKWTRVSRDTAAGKAKDVRNRTVGVMHEARKAVGVPVGSQSESDDFATESGQSNGNGFENADPSTTDTWGERPEASRIEVG